MKNTTGLKIVGVFAAAAALAFAGTPAFAAPQGAASAYTCGGGEIPSGAYSSITVTGPCAVAPDATITVTGNITVAGGAAFDAQSAPSTITVGHNVTAAAGSMLGLGCQSPAAVGNSGHECAVDPDGRSVITVNGNITATNAAIVLINGITVRSNITATGGGSPAVPWSIKNNAVSGNITVSGQTTNWLGVMFNTVGGNVTLSDITITDPDGTGNGAYVAQNTIGHNLTCNGVTPKVSGSFVPGKPNIVGHKATGQCATLV